MTVNRSPALIGLSRGPGNRRRQVHFNRPNPAKEMRLQMGEMERNGQLNTPQQKRMAAELVKDAESRPHPNIDYDVDGMPGIDRPPK